MNFWSAAGLVCLVAFITPFVIYLSVKLGVYARQRGLQLWNEEQQTQRRKDRGYKEG